MKANKNFEKDTIKILEGELIITFVGHGSLMMEYNSKIIHIDPFSTQADYSTMPKADLILLTHHHPDHFDINALEQINTENTIIIASESCQHESESWKMKTMKNGDKTEAIGLSIEAVPAYNLVHKIPNGPPFHPKGDGNGYIVSFAGFNVYIAGDTENIPEMNSLKNIDIAFLPMNIPFTMTPDMVADAARAFKPKVLYPYHYGNTDTNELVELLKDQSDIEVRIRKM